MVELLFLPEVKPAGQNDTTQPKGKESTVGDARHSAAAEKARLVKEGAALTVKGTIPAVELSSTALPSEPVFQIDTSGPGWDKKDGYAVKTLANHEYQKVWDNGTIEIAAAEGKDGDLDRLEKIVVYPNGFNKRTIVHVDAQEHWTEDPSIGILGDLKGNERRWGPERNDNYTFTIQDNNRSTQTFADGRVETITYVIDPINHQETQLKTGTSPSGEITSYSQIYPNGTAVLWSKQEIELFGEDQKGNFISITKEPHGQPGVELTNYRESRRAKIGIGEIPEKLRSLYEQRVVPF